MNTDDSDATLSDDERIWVLLDRYLAGDAQSSEVAIVRDWVSADPRRADVLEDLRRIRQVAIASRRHRTAGEAWQKLLLRLDVDAGSAQPAVAAFAPDSGILVCDEPRVVEIARAAALRKRLRYAAAALLLLAAGLSTVVTVRFASRRSSAQSPDVSRSFATGRGRRAEVRLPDGTRVSLAPESRVTWTAPRDSLSRDVMLEGEAYFDVVHDERRPFRVRARNVVIHDVGTRFAVRAYTTDSLVRVVVTQGRIRVRAAASPSGSGTTLDAGMLGLVDTAGVTALQTGADTARYNAFARGQMQFVRTPLRTVIGELERWYDIDIRLADSTLGSRRITATLEDQTLPDLLAQLSITLNLRVTRDGRLVVLHSN